MSWSVFCTPLLIDERQHQSDYYSGIKISHFNIKIRDPIRLPHDKNFMAIVFHSHFGSTQSFFQNNIHPSSTALAVQTRLPITVI